MKFIKLEPCCEKYNILLLNSAEAEMLLSSHTSHHVHHFLWVDSCMILNVCSSPLFNQLQRPHKPIFFFTFMLHCSFCSGLPMADTEIQIYAFVPFRRDYKDTLF